MKIAKHIKLNLGYNCPNRCSYCFNYDRSDSNPRKTNNFGIKSDQSTVESIVAICAQKGIFNMTFTGGEPLLYRDLLYPALEATRRWSIQSYVNSNIVDLTARDADLLKGIGVIGLFTSAPHHTKPLYNRITQSQNYDRFINALNLCRSKDIPLSLNMVATNENYTDIYEAGKHFYQQYGVVNFGASPIFPTTKAHTKFMLTPHQIEGIFDMLLELRAEFGINVSTFRAVAPCFSDRPERYKDFTRGCGAVRNELTIEADGTLRVCNSIPTAFGNVFEKSIEDIVGNIKPFLPFENGELYQVLPQECRPCAEALRCRGGCRVEAYTVNGEYNSVNPYFKGPLTKKLMPEIPELPDFTVGHLKIFIPRSAIRMWNNLPVHLDYTEEKFTEEETALIDLLVREKDEKSIVDPNLFRIKYRLKQHLFLIFLNKLSHLGLIAKTNEN